MPLKYCNNLKQLSRKLRHDMTDAEKAVWQKIRNKQIRNCQFYRQKPVGNYIVDFFCPKAKLVIEVDGSQHYNNGEGVEKDKGRDYYLQSLGLNVLRFTDIDVLKNIGGVVNKISEIIK